MNKNQSKTFIYLGILTIAILIGGNVITYVFGGVITLLAFVFLIESSPLLKKIVYHLNILFDIAFFIFGIYAKIHFGVTVAMSILFAGIGYTLMYGPYIRDTYKLK